MGLNASAGDACQSCEHWYNHIHIRIWHRVQLCKASREQPHEGDGGVTGALAQFNFRSRDLVACTDFDAVFILLIGDKA